MKKIIFNLVILFSVTLLANNDPIINFPDPDFKAKLLAASPTNPIASIQTTVVNEFGVMLVSDYVTIDTNNDGEIQVSEASAITWLKINYGGFFSGNKISSLEGILHFNNLVYLSCSSNLLSTLNLQGLTSLQAIRCENNVLTNLNVAGLTNLKSIRCENNQLTSLSVVGLNNLEVLGCYNNELTSLDIQDLPNLKRLNCYNNQLSNLHVANCSQLELISCYDNQLTNMVLQGLDNLLAIGCSNNQLTNLNLQGFINLQSIHASNNQITSLDLSGLVNLQTIYVPDNLITSIDISGCQQTFETDFSNNQLVSLIMINGYNDIISLSGNPNLAYICVDESELDYYQNLVNTYGYTDCQVNSYCSFIPGGNYNTITGQLKFDYSNNGCAIDYIPLVNHKLHLNDGTNMSYFFTNPQGNFNAYVGSGTHTIVPQFENPSLFILSSPSAQVIFEDNNNNSETHNFCITPNGEHMDVEVIFIPLNPPAIPGDEAEYKLIYRNLGNQVANGIITLNYMADVMQLILSSVSPSNQNSGQLTWSYQNLMPCENRTITIRFSINSPTQTPPITINDVLEFKTDITPLLNDIHPLNNSQIHLQTVVASFDPNDKTCLQGNTPSPAFIGEYVHYLIRFENTGTYYAQNVVIRDEIDDDKFDIHSLVVLDASHDMLNTRILNGQRLEFIFEGIQLPFPPSDERHGYVLFKIKTKNTLQVNDTFANQASIYFDYNWPIETNNEVSTITALSTPSFAFSDKIALYPNPAKDVIHLSAKAGINLKSIEIYNILGQLMLAFPNDSNERSIDVSHLSKGTYIINVYTDKGNGYTNFVKN